MYQQESWRYIQPVINEILLDTFHLLFKENNDIKEKFFNFKNAAIEDLNKKWGGGLGTTTGNGSAILFFTFKGVLEPETVTKSFYSVSKNF